MPGVAIEGAGTGNRIVKEYKRHSKLNPMDYQGSSFPKGLYVSFFPYQTKVDSRNILSGAISLDYCIFAR